MTGLRQKTVPGGRMAARICCVAAAMMLVGEAAAQAPQAPAQSQVQPQAQPNANSTTDPGYRPGFIDAFGQWIGSSVSNWNEGLKGAADAAKGAAVRFPGTRVIAERATCPTAPNGAPDCRAAAETICKAHGFASGGSIDFQTAEKCPPIALNHPDGEPPRCVIESYVTRALCQ
jgi:hypothetical protein